MTYRGDDLDLRTPQTWSAASAEPPNWGPADPGGPRIPRVSRGGPIWVDETVLAAVNHAFDFALAHRSAEVRLEHLLNALTRIDAAAEAMEARGVRVTALRRESATVIASDIPVGFVNGRTAPRRSDELEHVLRVASAQASRRSSPATVDDILTTIMDIEPDLPGLALLSRQSLRPPVAPGESTMPPAYTRPGYGADVRYEQDYYRGDRQRGAAGYYLDAPRAPAGRGDTPATPTDSVQNSRLDALEQMVRALGTEREPKVATDRSQGVLTTRLDAIEEAARASGSDAGAVIERMNAIERIIQANAAEAARNAERVLEAARQAEEQVKALRAQSNDLSTIESRLEIIEQAVLSRGADKSGEIVQRLADLEQAAATDRSQNAEATAARLAEIKALANIIEHQRSEIAVAVLTPLAQRLDVLLATVENRQTEATKTIAMQAERITNLERMLGDYATKTAEAQATHALELGEVHDALVKINANQHTLAGSIEAWRQDGSQSFSAVSARLDGFGPRFEAVEGAALKPIQMLEYLSGSMDRMHRITVERYYRRNRVWYWLFGTDDWVAASWPSQARRLNDELGVVRSVPPAGRK